MQTDIKLSLISGAFLIYVGIILGIYADSHIKELQQENVELMRLNYDLIQENDSLRYCVPTKIKGRAVVSYVNSRLFCEVHEKS